MRGFDGALPLSAGGKRAGRYQGAPGSAGGKPGGKREQKRTAAHAAVRGQSADNPRTISGRSADDQRTISGRSADDQRTVSSGTQYPGSQGQSKRPGGLDSLNPGSNEAIKEGGALPKQRMKQIFFESPIDKQNRPRYDENSKVQGCCSIT